MSVASPTGRVLSRVLRGCRCKRTAGWTGISAGPPLPSKHPYRPLAARLEAAADRHPPRPASTARQATTRLLRGYYEGYYEATTRLLRGYHEVYYGLMVREEITRLVPHLSPLVLREIESESAAVRSSACMLALSVAVLTLTAPATRFRATATAVPRAVGTPAPLWSPVSPVRSPNSPSEYDLNVGSLVDSLRHDYPLMLVSEPDLSLFTETMEFCGGPWSVRGLERYRKALGSLRWAKKVAKVDTEVGTRIVLSGGAVRVRWTCKVGAAVVDGISVYELNARGHVKTHRLENIATHGGDLNRPPISTALAQLTGALDLIGGRSAQPVGAC